MASGAGRKYAVVTPARNEAGYIRHTLESVTRQTEQPAIWVIVDDGSTDETAKIVGEFAQGHRFIKLLSLTDDAKKNPDRLLWAAEVVAFNTGLAEVDMDAVDFIVKLDGDLRFGPEYFAALLDEFERDPSLGMAGGYCYEIRDGVRIIEWNPRTHVRGPTKMYRKACFEQIGGIPPVYAWDALDEIKAQMHGWRTGSFDLIVDHLKATGTIGGLLHARVRQGIGAYLLGYHPLFLFARAARLALGSPYVIGGPAFLWGYLKAAFRKLPRIADPETVRYLRAQQMGRLRGLFRGGEVGGVLGKGSGR
ncbi:MAG: glycosyltransferase family 2 protein [Coriobacteriia bacterium]|nr:glycosyltransferase family 2 protein [Coriobacteriia bacterium]